MVCLGNRDHSVIFEMESSSSVIKSCLIEVFFGRRVVCTGMPHFLLKEYNFKNRDHRCHSPVSLDLEV